MFDWAAGSTHNITAVSTVPVAAGGEGAFRAWAGSISSSKDQLLLTTQEPLALTANYVVNYATLLRFVDQSGQSVGPSDIILTGATSQVAVPSSGLVWISNGSYYVTSAEWKGSQMVHMGDYPQFSVGGSTTQSFKLPIYNVDMVVRDLFGDPLSGATVTVLLPDGSSVTGTTNSTGHVSFSQLPEASLELTARYLGVSSALSLDPSRNPSPSLTVAFSYPVCALVGFAAGTTVLAAFVIRLRRRSVGEAEGTL